MSTGKTIGEGYAFLIMGEYINSKQIRIDKSLISCGVLQAHHIPADTGHAAFAICTHLYHKANPRPAAFIVWSDKAKKKDSRGQELREALEKIPKGGSITTTGTAINPKTGNPIQVWIWEPNHEAVRKWYQEEHMNALREADNDEP